MAVLAGELYAMGGYDKWWDQDWKALKTVEKYNGRSWEMVKGLDDKFYEGSSVVIN